MARKTLSSSSHLGSACPPGSPGPGRRRWQGAGARVVGAAGCGWARGQRELLLGETGDSAFWLLQAQHIICTVPSRKQISSVPFNGWERVSTVSVRASCCDKRPRLSGAEHYQGGLHFCLVWSFCTSGKYFINSSKQFLKGSEGGE